jgi:hypothetical protein
LVMYLPASSDVTSWRGRGGLSEGRCRKPNDSGEDWKSPYHWPSCGPANAAGHSPPVVGTFDFKS